MGKEVAMAAGIVLLAFLLMALSRNLYPMIPSVTQSITLEEPIENVTTTTTPGGQETTSPRTETTTTTATTTTTTTTTTTITTTPSSEKQELGIAFYNSILAVINLEGKEEEIKGSVEEAYVAGVEGTCSSCVGVLIVKSENRKVAVVLINTWNVENGEEHKVNAVELARLLLGSEAEFHAVKVGFKIEGLEAYAALRVEWKHHEAELVESNPSPED